MKYCPRCELEKDRSEFTPNRARYDGLSGYCRTCMNEVEKASIYAWVLKAHAALEDICARCGFKDHRALQIDHPNGGGHADRGTSRRAFYKKVIANPGDYTLLCANCNTIKRIENKEFRPLDTYSRISDVVMGDDHQEVHTRKDPSCRSGNS